MDPSICCSWMPTWSQFTNKGPQYPWSYRHSATLGSSMVQTGVCAVSPNRAANLYPSSLLPPLNEIFPWEILSVIGQIVCRKFDIYQKEIRYFVINEFSCHKKEMLFSHRCSSFYYSWYLGSCFTLLSHFPFFPWIPLCLDLRCRYNRSCRDFFREDVKRRTRCNEGSDAFNPSRS